MAEQFHNRNYVTMTMRSISWAVLAVLVLIGPVLSVHSASSYWAIAASYTDCTKAAEIAASLSSATKIAGSVMEADVKGTRYYRVALGPFGSRSDAELARSGLNNLGWKDAWILIAEENAIEVADAGPEASVGQQVGVKRSIKVGLSWLSGTEFLAGTDGVLSITGKMMGSGEESIVESKLIAEIISEADGIRVKRTEDEEGTLFISPISISADSGALWLSDMYKVYKGIVEVARKVGSSSLYAANLIDVEDYLLSVLPSEIGGSSPAEAYKAQAVVARTEAFSSAGRHADMGWDLCDSTHCQVFKGLYGQSANIEILKAVIATTGEVLTFEGTMVRTASFHSACGGRTESSEEIWGSRLAHLTSVRDKLSQDPMPDLTDEIVLEEYIKTEDKADLCYKAFGYRWSAEIAIKDVQGRLAGIVEAGTALTTGQAGGGSLPRVSKRSIRGAALELLVPYGGGEYIIRGELNIRKLLGGATVIKSGVFLIQGSTQPGFVKIIGAGYGHGVGMCQEGAKTLARLGRDCKAILGFYYRGTSIGKLY